MVVSLAEVHEYLCFLTEGYLARKDSSKETRFDGRRYVENDSTLYGGVVWRGTREVQNHLFLE
jgi:hypothetical protein